MLEWLLVALQLPALFSQLDTSDKLENWNRLLLKVDDDVDNFVQYLLVKEAEGQQPFDYKFYSSGDQSGSVGYEESRKLCAAQEAFPAIILTEQQYRKVWRQICGTCDLENIN